MDVVVPSFTVRSAARTNRRGAAYPGRFHHGGIPMSDEEALLEAHASATHRTRVQFACSWATGLPPLARLM
jgi:hypothetical protein